MSECLPFHKIPPSLCLIHCQQTKWIHIVTEKQKTMSKVFLVDFSSRDPSSLSALSVMKSMWWNLVDSDETSLALVIKSESTSMPWMNSGFSGHDSWDAIWRVSSWKKLRFLESWHFLRLIFLKSNTRCIFSERVEVREPRSPMAHTVILAKSEGWRRGRMCV